MAYSAHRPQGLQGARRLAPSPDRAAASASRSRTRSATSPTIPFACLPRRLANSPASWSISRKTSTTAPGYGQPTNATTSSSSALPFP